MGISLHSSYNCAFISSLYNNVEMSVIIIIINVLLSRKAIFCDCF